MDKSALENEEEKDKTIFDGSTYKTLMFYNTTLRNVGLYTSVAVALLGYASRLKGDNSKWTKFFFLLASTSFLLISMYLNYNMYSLLYEVQKGSVELTEDLKHWLNISKMIFPIHVVIFFMIIGYVIMNLQWHIKHRK